LNRLWSSTGVNALKTRQAIDQDPGDTSIHGGSGFPIPVKAKRGPNKFHKWNRNGVQLKVAEKTGDFASKKV
jgi:hypothetical protein